jgi:Zn-dependent M28 family amino/carboxypeptidase
MRMRWRTAFTGVLLMVGLAPIFLLTQPVWPKAPERHPVEFPPEGLEAKVRKISEGFGPRDAWHPENLDRLARFLADEWRKTGGKVWEQPVEAGPYRSRNVIAEFGPQTHERIVIGAHYDARGPLPGADDNASGVAGVWALAQAFATSPPPLRVELVAYTLEEYGLGGSQTHAAYLAQTQKAVRAMFSLEMLGFFTDAPNSQKLPVSLLKPLYPSTGNFIAVIGRWDEPWLLRRIKSAMQAHGGGLDVRSINAPTTLRGIAFSDHASYWKHDFPAVMVTDTAFYRNPGYHTAQDTADTLDYGRMSQVVRAVHGAVLQLASAP